MLLRALLAAALLAAANAHAQDAGLRGAGGDDLGSLPGSVTDAPTLVPDRNAPPSITAAPSDADDASPTTTAQNPPDANDPNYARARLRKGKLYAPNLKSNPPLSPLVAYRTSARPLRGAAAVAARAQTRAAVSPNGAPNPAPNPAPQPRELLNPQLPGPTFAAIAYPQRNTPPALAEADAFAPVAVRVGDLRLLPFVEGSTGYQSNPNQVQVGIRPSSEFRIDAGTAIESDFSNNSLTGNLRGGYSLFPSNSNADRPDVSALLDGRIDVTRDTKINTEARLVVVTQTPGSALLAVPNSAFVTSRPLIVSAGATLGASQQFGRVNLDLRGTIDRTPFGNATQSDGTVFLYSQENFNDYGVVARASYELTPGIIPFVETAVDARVRDTDLDYSGYLRNSRGILGRIGSSFEFFGHFTGTLSGGYADRHYDDPRLPNLRGPTADGSLVYAFSPLTTVTLPRQHDALGDHAAGRLRRDLTAGQPGGRPRVLPPFHRQRHRHLSAQRIPGRRGAGGLHAVHPEGGLQLQPGGAADRQRFAADAAIKPLRQRLQGLDFPRRRAPSALTPHAGPRRPRAKTREPCVDRSGWLVLYSLHRRRRCLGAPALFRSSR